MARGVIGKLPVVYDPVARRVVVENSAEFVETQIRQKLDELAHGKPLHLILSVDLERKSRTLPQNRMMWALLTIMADHYNGAYFAQVLPAGARCGAAGRQPLHGEVQSGFQQLYHGADGAADRRNI